jgi:hypothetical protein
MEKEKPQYQNILNISKKIIFIDIDGIITNETKGFNYKYRTPNLENIEIINKLFDNNKIILYTSRYLRDYFITKKWLKKYKVKYHKIIFNKYKYDIFIDDKSFNKFEEIK